MIERGCAHPLLGPLVLIVLALLLAAVFLHVAMEGAEAAMELGEVCVAIAAALGLLLMFQLRLAVVPEQLRNVDERAPPSVGSPTARGPTASLAAPLTIPLRR